MPVTVVIGGQFGSEGKGKVAHEFARRKNARVAVRVGGSNSGHTVIDQSGRVRRFRHLPTAAILPDVICVLGAGTYIDVEILLREITECRLPPDRLVIDPNAVIVTDTHKRQEREWGLVGRIGSTGSGTGAAVVDRVKRDPSLCFAKDDLRLSHFVGRPARELLRDHLDRGNRIIAEGTQGFGLSILHTDHYPHATSRDTTAAAVIAECGLSPLDVDDVVLVIRAFPIRVAGKSGPLPREIDWDAITRESGSVEAILEKTTVTDSTRRVGRFDPDVVTSAIICNNPNTIVLNHLDYIDFASRSQVASTDKIKRFVQRVEFDIQSKISLLGFGPDILIVNDSSDHVALAS